MIFIDSNIPMYLVGASHPNKVLAQQGLEACIVHDERLVTDVEVYQEILHRYVAIARREAISPAFAALTGIVLFRGQVAQCTLPGMWSKYYTGVFVHCAT